MNNKYILNKNKQDSPSGENYEVHKEDNTCTHLPLLENRLFLGYFDNCRDALEKAKIGYPHWEDDIDGCYYCANPCHRE